MPVPPSVVVSVAGSVVGTDVRGRRPPDAGCIESRTSEEDIMYEHDSTISLIQQRHAELVAEAERYRLAREVKRADRTGAKPVGPRRRWRLALSGRLAAAE
jgi:hypothetical protein